MGPAIGEDSAPLSDQQIWTTSQYRYSNLSIQDERAADEVDDGHAEENFCWIYMFHMTLRNKGETQKKQKVSK